MKAKKSKLFLYCVLLCYERGFIPIRASATKCLEKSRIFRDRELYRESGWSKSFIYFLVETVRGTWILYCMVTQN